MPLSREIQRAGKLDTDDRDRHAYMSLSRTLGDLMVQAPTVAVREAHLRIVLVVRQSH